ncbi:hypothetical protein DFJ74DRAFT_20800 [Hyaloraphidium curvatum]|nr:hypothetical protein DFJ74DRAFT_20800 [Hyaloraphidium curvatum]
MGRKNQRLLSVVRPPPTPPRARDEAPKATRSVNELLSLMRKFNRNPPPSGGPLADDSGVDVVLTGKRVAAGPTPKTWKDQTVRAVAQKELQSIRREIARRTSRAALEDSGTIPSLRRLCCAELASRLKDFAAEEDAVRLFLILPVHLRDEILQLASSRIVITDRVLKTLFVGDIPSRILDISGSRVSLPALRRILPVGIGKRKSFGPDEDEHDGTVALDEPETWEDTLSSSSDDAWSNEETTLPDRLAEPPLVLNVSFCSHMDPMLLAWTVMRSAPLLTSLCIAGTFRGEFSAAALLALCKALISLRHLDVSASSAWLKQSVAEEAAFALTTRRLETFVAILCDFPDVPKLRAIVQSRYPDCDVIV